MKKILLTIFDGLADRPIPDLDGKTPLEVAHIPNLDYFAETGECGTQNALPPREYPTSEEAHFSIFGYDPKVDLPGRGVLEAMGLGIKLNDKELVLRVDFGTVDDSLTVIDPRAGNISSINSFCEFIGEQKIGPLTFRIYPGLAHRAVLVISGDVVSKEIAHHSTIVTDTDPHKSKIHMGGNKVLVPHPLDRSAEALLTAETLWEYQLFTHKMLDGYVENRVRIRQGLPPANFILTRGAGFVKPVASFWKKYHLKAVCVAAAPLYKGIGTYLGMKIVNVKGATGGVDTDIDAKVKAAQASLSRGADFVFLHLKGADVVAEEEGNWEKKIAFLEKADKAFAALKNFKGVLCITGDHATPCILKDHSSDPVPIVIWGSTREQGIKFNEADCKKGSLGHLKGSKIMDRLITRAKNV